MSLVIDSWVLRFSLCFLVCWCSRQVNAEKPNVVILLADDLGYGDMQANQPDRSKIPTPQMNRLATEGMRFTDGHSSSACCSPSRYTLLTGRYHWRTRLQSGIVGVWERPLIPADRWTIASLARQHGYATAAIGKWHLGHDWPIQEAQKKFFQGFGGKPGGGGKVSVEVTEEHREVWREVFSQPIPGGPTACGFDHYFGTDVPNWPPYCFLENDRAVGVPSALLPESMLVKNQASLQGPALPQWQLDEVLPALVARAKQFIHQQAAAGKPFLLYLPLTSPHTPLAVNEPWRGKSGLGSDYADLVMETDAAIGAVLDALREASVDQNTLVLLTSDNGCASYIGVQGLESQGHFPSGPLRGYKSQVYEGGHRVPFVVRWPSVVEAGTVCHRLVHHADLMATLADILGQQLPEGAGEDSFSFLPLLKGSQEPIREHAVSTACDGLPSFRMGPWKYIAKSPPELYHLEEDLSEKNNLAQMHTSRLQELQAAFETIIRKGRSTPGAPQKNEQKVVRYPKVPRAIGDGSPPKDEKK
ncbi:MAG: sulfatase family protein [Pirellulaceae bacterium]